ncbi:MAG: hypothetical protein MOGMAGMI_01826 [Candidatus Omnitrophica bacterium]|nr:hypothetical protein [Ignavibacteriaceae bacterium]MCG3176862.1 hypothetical protein [Candidatus Omnitrophota bacterium]
MSYYFGRLLYTMSQADDWANEKGTISLMYQENGRWRKPSYSLTRERFECDCEEMERAFLQRRGKGGVVQVCSHVRKMISVFERVHDKSTKRIRTIPFGMHSIEVIDYETQV